MKKHQPPAQNTVNPRREPTTIVKFRAEGLSVRAWAIAHGFSYELVYQVLKGNRKCLRGQSHKIAKELGMK